MTARRKAERVVKRLLTANKLEELFRGGLEERRITFRILGDLAASGERYGKLARRVASREGVTYQYVLDRVMVFLASIGEIRSKDIFRQFGVTPSATLEEIHKRWRKLAKEVHPDAEGGDSEAFRRARKAYETLADPKRRAWYDGYWAKEVAPVERALVLPSTPPWGRVWGQVLKYQSVLWLVLSRAVALVVSALRAGVFGVGSLLGLAGAAMGRIGGGALRGLGLSAKRIAAGFLAGVGRVSGGVALLCGRGGRWIAEKGVPASKELARRGRGPAAHLLVGLAGWASVFAIHLRAAIIRLGRVGVALLRLVGGEIGRKSAVGGRWVAGAVKTRRLEQVAGVAVFAVAFVLTLTLTESLLPPVSDQVESGRAVAPAPGSSYGLELASQGLPARLLSGDQSYVADGPGVSSPLSRPRGDDLPVAAELGGAARARVRRESSITATAAPRAGKGAAPNETLGGVGRKPVAPLMRAKASTGVQPAPVSAGNSHRVKQVPPRMRDGAEQRRPRSERPAVVARDRRSASPLTRSKSRNSAAWASPAAPQLRPRARNPRSNRAKSIERRPVVTAQRVASAATPTASHARKRENAEAASRRAGALPGATALTKDVSRDEAINFMAIFRRRYEELDASRLSALFAKDASENQVAGRHRIAAAYRSAFETMDRARYLLGKAEVRPLGPWADVRAPFTIAYRDTAGHYGEIAGRGRWWLVREGAGLKVLRLEYEIDHRAD